MSRAGSDWRLTLGAVALVAGAALIVEAAGANGVVSVLLFLSAVLGASLGGRVPGIVAALLSAVVINVWVHAPEGELLTTSEDLGAVAAFVALGAIVGTLVHRNDEARRRADLREREARTRLELVDHVMAGTPISTLADVAASALVDLSDLACVEISGDGIASSASREDVPRGEPEVVEVGLRVELTPRKGRRVAPEDRELVRSLVSVVNDAASQAAREEETARARVQAELARSRAIFFSAAGHNLRIPLSALVASVSVLSEDEGQLAPDDRREMLRTARAELDCLVRLVDKVLAMSRLNADADLEVKRIPVDLQGIVQTAVKRFGLLARNHRFELDIPADLGVVFLDVVMVEQLLLNLLENAVHVSAPDGEIAVIARAEEDVLVLEVVDHGPGVPPEDRERIFMEGERGRNPRGRGTGLGLAIVAAAAKAHGGSVRCLPTTGGGATMQARLPGTVAGMEQDRDPAGLTVGASHREVSM